MAQMPPPSVKILIKAINYILVSLLFADLDLAPQTQ
jgi:hypothetical protein